jgi:hypothetical protein
MFYAVIFSRDWTERRKFPVKIFGPAVEIPMEDESGYSLQ